jgi:hypothetical protein
MDAEQLHRRAPVAVILSGEARCQETPRAAQRFPAAA